MVEHWRVPRPTDTFTPMRIFVSITVFVLATVLLTLDVPPFPTWYYVFAWYPTLIIVDAIASARDQQPSLVESPGPLISVLGWSVVIWLLYEAINLRIANWYYVFLPPSLGLRWLGIVISFATVVPAVLLAERFLRSAGVGERWKPRPVVVRPGSLRAAVFLGLILLTLPLVWPTLLSPLVWGAGVLIADPVVYRLRRHDSLMGDLEAGRWGRIGRLLFGGLVIGLWWEMLNLWARGKWIYTVPFLEEIKLFEMPPFGFVGFPVFALSAWSLYHMLCAWNVALPVSRAATLHRTRSAGAIFAAVILSVVTLFAMERRTISSTIPTLENLPGVTQSVVETLIESDINTPFELAGASSGSLSGVPNLSSLQELAQVATLRGIGTTHLESLRRSGIESVCALAAANAENVWQGAHASLSNNRFRPTRAEVRVWIRAAERACDD